MSLVIRLVGVLNDKPCPQASHFAGQACAGDAAEDFVEILIRRRRLVLGILSAVRQNITIHEGLVDGLLPMTVTGVSLGLSAGSRAVASPVGINSTLVSLPFVSLMGISLSKHFRDSIAGRTARQL